MPIHNTELMTTLAENNVDAKTRKLIDSLMYEGYNVFDHHGDIAMAISAYNMLGKDEFTNRVKSFPLQTLADDLFFSIGFDDTDEMLDIAKEQMTPIEGIRGIAICKKCGYDMVTSTSKQTRSADEGKTAFYKCVRCNNTWRPQQ